MPMAGGGTRFKKNEIDIPKPLIEINDKPFFFWAAQSILKFIEIKNLIFVVLKEHIEKYNILDQNGEYNEKALNAFSYFAKTALNDFDIEDIDPLELINHYIGATVVHVKATSTKDPNKEVTFVNLGDKWSVDGFDTEPVAKAMELGPSSQNNQGSQPFKAKPNESGGLDIDALLG